MTAPNHSDHHRLFVASGLTIRENETTTVNYRVAILEN